MARFWENDPVAEAPASGGAPQPIFTVPDPVGEAKRGEDGERLRLAQEESARQAAAEARAAQKFGQEQSEDATKKQAQAAALTDSLAQMRNVVQAAEEAKAMSKGWFATGVGSETAAKFAGTSARDLRSRIDTIAANNAFSQLQAMRAASPTGGALGAVSERELALLQSTISSLDPSQSDAQFQASMDRIIESYQRVIGRLEGQQPDDGTRRPEMRGGVPVGTQVEFGMDQAGQEGFDRNRALQEVYGVTPNQEAAITAFWNSNRGNAAVTPDGVRAFYREIGAPPPSDEEIARGIEAARNGYQFGSFDTAEAEQQWQQRLETEAAARAARDGAPGAIDLAGHGVTAGLSDEARGVGGAIGATLRGDNPLDAYRFENDLRDYQLAQARERTGWGGAGLELLGNAASLGAGAITSLPGSMRAAVREGAIAGSVPGFGYGEGAAESAAGVGIGAASGAALGRLFAPGGAKPPTDGSRVMRAADDLNREYGSNIIPLPADVGGATVRRATGAAAQMPFGAAPIVNAAKAVNSEAAAAKNAIAARVAPPQELEAAGNAALSGSNEWMKRTRTKVNALYTKARSLSEGVAVPLTNARRVLDEHISELEATPGGVDGVAKLKALRDEIGEDYTVDAIKRMRTTLRERFIGDGLRKSDIERRVGQVVDAAEQDVADGLTGAGKGEAAEAWTAAAAAARDRLQTIDNVLAPIIGKKGDAPRSGEQIMQSVASLAKGNNARLAKFLRTLPADDAATVRSTVISRLGTTDAEAANFSLGQFASQWEKMPNSAKRTLFGGELTEALDKLATVAGGAREAMKFANHSNTGSVAGMGATALTGGVDLVSGGVFAAGQYVTGRMLASPRFARWLARMPKAPAAQQQHVKDLSKIAAAESAIAADALNLQAQIASAFQGGSARVQPIPLAAQEPTSPQSQETRGPR